MDALSLYFIEEAFQSTSAVIGTVIDEISGCLSHQRQRHHHHFPALREKYLQLLTPFYAHIPSLLHPPISLSLKISHQILLLR